MLNKTKAVGDLNRFLKKGRMSKDLRYAVQELILALRENDLELAYELSAVKSLITGEIGFMGSAFGEDMDYNKKVFGKDLYCYLDFLHYDLALAVDRMPSGAMILTTEGAIKKGRPIVKHPVIRTMEKEHRMIREEAEKRWAKEEKRERKKRRVR